MDRLARVLHLEHDILDQESPDLVAEAICIKMTLLTHQPSSQPTFAVALPRHLPSTTNLERQSRLHLIGQHFRNRAIEVREDLHRQLRLDATLADEVVERVRQRHADARQPSQYFIVKSW